MLSDQSLVEFDRVVARDSAKHERYDHEVARTLSDHLHRLDRVDDRATRSPVRIRDPKDECLVRTAIAGNAEYIVSVDKDMPVIADDLRLF